MYAHLLGQGMAVVFRMRKCAGVGREWKARSWTGEKSW
jgi:hypothetical protein